MRHLLFCMIGVFCISLSANAQFNRNFGGMGGGKMQIDTSNHEHEPDTLTIRYTFLGEPTEYMIDSSILDFTKNYLGVPATYISTGNYGGAARNLLFSPRMKAGFDAGFHAYDVYGNYHETAKFYNTNRPYSELYYMIGSKQEQVIGVSHTQNRTEKFNIAFDYIKINSPGYYRSQVTNHDRYRLTSRYHTPNKRYNIHISYYLNRLNGGENGGIENVALLDDPAYTDYKTIPTNLGGSTISSNALFSTNIPTKSDYQEGSFLFQHSYDWGRGDTIHVNDTTDYWKYDPRFRIQHTLTYTQNTYRFLDSNPDTVFYPQHYGFSVSDIDTLRSMQRWKIMSNDLSIISFPILGNQAHFLNLGATIDNVKGELTDAIADFYNFRVHGEYRNKTRNKKWDLSAKGEFYVLGANSGDYTLSGSLSRYINPKLGNITLAVKNTNQEPYYKYKFFSTSEKFWLNTSFNKENITKLSFIANSDLWKYNLSLNYFIVTNYTYFSDFQTSAQYNGVFNVLQLWVDKKFKLKSFTWLAEAAFQQIHGSAPLQLPTIWTRHRIGYEGTLFKNLNLFTGIEAKYTTAYYADDYSPLFGQFVYQDVTKINNKPDLAAFVHFRVKSFTAYVRGENLNAFLWTNNLNAPLYPSNNFAFRLGIRWWYIN